MIIAEIDNSRVERLRNSVSGDMEYVCTDLETNEGYRTSNCETARQWCSMSRAARNDLYSGIARCIAMHQH